MAWDCSSSRWARLISYSARYAAIGESDRMTLRFVKPAVSRRRR
jgi:predicted methyltransferase